MARGLPVCTRQQYFILFSNFRLLARLYLDLDPAKSLLFAEQAVALGDIASEPLLAIILDKIPGNSSQISNTRLQLISQLLSKIDPAFAFNVSKSEMLKNSGFINFITGHHLIYNKVSNISIQLNGNLFLLMSSELSWCLKLSLHVFYVYLNIHLKLPAPPVDLKLVLIMHFTFIKPLIIGVFQCLLGRIPSLPSSLVWNGSSKSQICS